MTHHRMTAKARKGLKVMHEISGENPRWGGTSHELVKEAYELLAYNGYEWVTEKQEWAYVVQPEAKTLQYICLSCPLEIVESAALMIRDGAILNDVTLGEVTKINIVTETGQLGVMLYIEVWS